MYKEVHSSKLSIGVSVAHVVVLRVQCNRRYPCNQCTKRRQPEACIYQNSEASHQTPQTESRLHEHVPIAPLQEITCSEGVAASADWGKPNDPTPSCGSNSLGELFGYVQHSESNTLALILKVSNSASSPGDFQRRATQRRESTIT